MDQLTYFYEDAARPDYATHYSYDITGNVNHMVQGMPELDVLGHRFKLIAFAYDLISGKVNQAYYQRDSADQFNID